MTAFASLVTSPVVERLGWTLFHFCWQGIVLAIVIGLTLAYLRRRSANARYLVSCTGLLAMSVAPVVTFMMIPAHEIVIDTPPPSVLNEPAAMSNALPAIVSDGTAALAEVREATFPSEEAVPMASSSTWQERFCDGLLPYLPWITAVWIVGVIMLSSRLVVGWIHVQRLKCLHVRPVSSDLEVKLAALCDRLCMSPSVRLLESTLARAPMTLGWLRPVILVPTVALTGLTPEQLHAVLAHELAHIRRYDYLVNLIQSAIETLLFYHPAVWWLSHRIRIERENCCDDIAVAVVNDRVGYARALTNLAELRVGAGGLAVAADGGSLYTRIRRIVGISSPSSHLSRYAAGTLVFLGIVLAGVFVHVTTLDAAVAVEEHTPTSQPASQPAHPARERAKSRKPQLPPMARAGMKKFQTLVVQKDWDRLFWMCSPDVRRTALTYPSKEAFFAAVVPVDKIVELDEFPICGSRHKGDEWSYYESFVRLVEEKDRTISWTWRIHYTDDGPEFSFYTISLKDWIEQETQRINAEQRRREAARARLEPKLKGVRTRLTPVNKSFVIGQPMKFDLVLINGGHVKLVYDHQQVAVNNSMWITDASGQEVAYVAGPIQTDGGWTPITPSEKATLFDDFDIASQYAIKTPGRYRVQFRGTGLDISDHDVHEDPFVSVEHRLWPSNVVEIKVLPAGGTEGATSDTSLRLLEIARMPPESAKTDQTKQPTRIQIEIIQLTGPYEKVADPSLMAAIDAAGSDYMEALNQIGRTEVLSAPEMVVDWPEVLTFAVGQLVPYPKNMVIGTDGKPVPQVDHKDIGLRATIKGQWREQGDTLRALMDIDLKYTSLAKQSVDIGSTKEKPLPIFTERSVSTRLELEAGKPGLVAGNVTRLDGNANEATGLIIRLTAHPLTKSAAGSAHGVSQLSQPPVEGTFVNGIPASRPASTRPAHSVRARSVRRPAPTYRLTPLTEMARSLGISNPRDCDLIVIAHYQEALIRFQRLSEETVAAEVDKLKRKAVYEEETQRLLDKFETDPTFQRLIHQDEELRGIRDEIAAKQQKLDDMLTQQKLTVRHPGYAAGTKELVQERERYRQLLRERNKAFFRRELREVEQPYHEGIRAEMALRDRVLDTMHELIGLEDQLRQEARKQKQEERKTKGVIYVSGDVNRPGVYSLSGPDGVTCVRLIAAAGGIVHPDSKGVKVELIRRASGGKETRSWYHLDKLETGEEQDFQLQANDQVRIAK